MRYLYLAVAAGLALLALAVPASASTTASIQGDTLTVTGDGAGDNILLVKTDATTLGIDETGDGNVDQPVAGLPPVGLISPGM